MTTVLEKAAIALFAHGTSADDRRPQWDDQPDPMKEAFRATVRTVLMAVREPSADVMVAAFVDVLEPVYPGDFQRVVDAILNEEPTPPTDVDPA